MKPGDIIIIDDLVMEVTQKQLDAMVKFTEEIKKLIEKDGIIKMYYGTFRVGEDLYGKIK